MYVQHPLDVFELDFEANLRIVRSAVRHRKRLLFPSTSEIYGMCPDEAFDPETSNSVYGPIHKQRWIYACSKQLMDRVIWAYGFEQKLDFTLFRPFNWIGYGLDSIFSAKEGSSRVLTQFLGHIVRGEPIRLVDGGRQRRSFTHVDDGVDALMAIIRNNRGIASGNIYNIGNPANDISVRELAERMLGIARSMPEYADSAGKVNLLEVSSSEYYGAGYQDIQHRVPLIENTRKDLNWTPRISIDDALISILESYRGHVHEARELLADR
jgi:nucleoside-diphosphate-sugar epimerase